MIENEIAKLEKPDQERFRSCAVPELGEVLLVVGQLASPSALQRTLQRAWAHLSRGQ